MEQQNENEKYRNIGTKVNVETYRILKTIAKKKHMKVYELLQMCADCLVRYTSDQYNLSPEMEKVMSIFEHMVGWHGAFNFADPAAKDKKVEEAVYFLDAKDRTGARAVLVKRPFMGDWQQDVNIQHIVERVLELIVPERYRRLRKLAVEMDCNSILDLLDLLIDSAVIQSLDLDEIRKGFEDCQRAENNKTIAYGERTRRKKHYSVEDTEAPVQGTIHFGPDDVPDLPELHKDKDKGKDFDPYNDPIGY
jgi:hypothetical protein